MHIASSLRKAEYIGIREFKEHISKKFLKETIIITDRGTPISVNIPYRDLIELMDILDEFTDVITVQTVRDGRAAINSGKKGINVSRLFKKIKENRK